MAMETATLRAGDSIFYFRTMPLYAHTKIFLVAGSGKSANFAQEILDQKKIWRKAGFSDDEIACYYVAPSPKELKGDEAQFLELAPELTDCYPASVALLRKHLQLIARGQVKPPFLYLYITSHGDRPQSGLPVLNQYFLRIDGLPDRETSTFSDLLKDYQAGTDPEELFMTPSYLRNLLEKNFIDVPKFIILQGCYTGGFVEDPAEPFRDQTLKSLSSLTLLTASRFDRTSFGCKAGETSTYFGGIFNGVLAERAGDPRRMDWKGLSDEVKEKVKAREQAEKHSPPSEPVFFSNYSPSAPPGKAEDIQKNYH
jgi:hypothetical protein